MEPLKFIGIAFAFFGFIMIIIGVDRFRDENSNIKESSHGPLIGGVIFLLGGLALAYYNVR